MDNFQTQRDGVFSEQTSTQMQQLSRILQSQTVAAHDPSCSSKPKIVVLATGGTIAGSQADVTQARYDAATTGVEKLIAAVAEIQKLADVRGEQLVNVASQNMTNDIWLTMARRIDEVLADESLDDGTLEDKVDGIVLTHGTDTLEETAFFLSLVVKSPKPIVLTGAMRPATALAADGPANLYNAVAVAAHPDSRGRGPLVVMNDEIFSAREIRKTHTIRPDAFQATNSGAVGVVQTGTVQYFAEHATQETPSFDMTKLHQADWPRVDIVVAHAGCDGKPIDAAVANGAKGIILAGVGNGNTSASALKALERAAQSGIVVVRASRVGAGIVGRGIEVDDDRYGLIAAMDLTPQKARILLMLALCEPRDLATIQALFRTSKAPE